MKTLLQLQKDEITSSLLYEMLGRRSKDERNKRVFVKLAAQEKRHYNFLARHTKKEVLPSQFLLFVYGIFATILGNTFVLKMMERSE